MLFLVFELGDEGYALAVDAIVEILPFIAPRKIRDAPREILGSISYRGDYLPVIDLSQLELGRPSTLRMGTRIVVTDIPAGERRARVGLVLESATETFRCEPEAFKPFAMGPRGLVQRIDLATLLPRRLRDAILMEPKPAR